MENKRQKEEYAILGCSVMYFVDSPTFRRNIPSHSSGSKSKLRKKYWTLLELHCVDCIHEDLRSNTRLRESRERKDSTKI
jgi:hypothetical protein